MKVYRARNTETYQFHNDPETIPVCGLKLYVKPLEQGIQPVSRAWTETGAM